MNQATHLSPIEFKELAEKAFSDISENSETQSTLLQMLDNLFSEIDRSMKEGSQVYIETVSNTSEFENLLSEIRAVVASIDPNEVNFNESFFNLSLKQYFKKLTTLNEELHRFVETIDGLCRGLKADLITNSIELETINKKLSRLRTLDGQLNEVYKVILDCSTRIKSTDIHTKLFYETRIQNSLESKREILTKAIIITEQRVAAILLNMDNSRKMTESMTTARTLTLELFGVLITLANETYKQKIILDSGIQSPDQKVSLDDVKQIYEKTRDALS